MTSLFGSRLFRKYATYFIALVGVSIVASGISSVYFAYQENRAALIALQGEKAASAALRIESYIRAVEHQLQWVHLLQRSPDWTLSQLQFEYLKLLRQLPAVTEVRYLDASGHEQLSISRLAPDVVGSGIDRSADREFGVTRSGQTYFGPVTFRRDTEPYMTIAMASGERLPGATVVDLNLRFVWDVVYQIRIGEAGHAYVVDGQGRLISHPELSLVLAQTDYSDLPQTRRALDALAASKRGESDGRQASVTAAHDRNGLAVLTAYAHVDELDWLVFVEQPRAEAFAPLEALALRIGLLLLLGLVLAVAASLLLARRMVRPIQALEVGAARIGSGTLGHRIDLRTGDELERLGEQFNAMAQDLQASYTDLERKIEERTRELELANRAKSRFLAAASHDLRQPMHALGLFIAQLRERVTSTEAVAIAEQAQASVDALGELFDALLDISRLDAGALTPEIETFPVDPLIRRLAEDYRPLALEKGIALRVVPSSLWVRTDAKLLEQILLNLVGNAVRYTSSGRVLLGCRRRADRVRVEVWDTGGGIPVEQQEEVFQEFSQLHNPERDRRKGLGLGLAIVQRLCRLLGHRLEMRSVTGVGSTFTIELPRAEPQAAKQSSEHLAQPTDHVRGAFVVVLDDDALARQGMTGLLREWGCHVVDAASSDEAIQALDAHERIPDAVVCDYRLPRETGTRAIARLRAMFEVDFPAVLVSGDIGHDVSADASKHGHPLLRKPVRPAKLRALLNRLLEHQAENAA